MFKINYDFQPGDKVFVNLECNELEAGIVVRVDFDVYENDTGVVIEDVKYTILLDDETLGTVIANDEDVHATLQLAADSLSACITPTPTPSITPSHTVTPSITPTHTATPSVTPTHTVTPSITPTYTPSPTVTPTFTPTPTVTPTVTVTPSSTPTIQNMTVLEADGGDSEVEHITLASFNVMSSGTSQGTLGISNQTITPSGLHIDSTGTRMFVLDTNGVIYRYVLSIPWDSTTAAYTSDFYNFTYLQSGDVNGLDFNATGTRLYLVNNLTVFQYDLNSPWDLSSIDPNFTSFSVSLGNKELSSVSIEDNGTKMYITDNRQLQVNQYDLSSAYDIASASFVRSLDIVVASQHIEDVQFSENGNDMFLLIDGFVRSYTLSVSWNLSSATSQGQPGIFNIDAVGRPVAFVLQYYP